MDLVQKIKKGDRFQRNTSPSVYTALSDEGTRGWVRCTNAPIEFGRVLRFNSNQDALTIIKEEGTK